MEDLGWQWAFHSAAIVSVVLFIVVAKFLPSGHPGTRMKVDYQTVILLIAGVSLLLLYMTEAPYVGWTDPYNLGALAAGVVLTVGFFAIESRRPNPLIPLHLLKIRNVMIANLAGILSQWGLLMVFFAVIYYAELKSPPAPPGLGLSVIAAGLSLAPATVVMLAGGPGLGRLTDRRGPKPTMMLGGLVAMAGFVLFLVNRGTTTGLVIDTAVSFLGLVGILIPIVNMVSVSLPDETVATGLGLNTMLRNIGGAIGPVVATTIMTTYSVKFLAPTGPVSLPTSTAFDYIFYLGVACMIAVVVFALATKNYVFRKQPPA